MKRLITMLMAIITIVNTAHAGDQRYPGFTESTRYGATRGTFETKAAKEARARARTKKLDAVQAKRAEQARALQESRDEYCLQKERERQSFLAKPRSIKETEELRKYARKNPKTTKQKSPGRRYEYPIALEREARRDYYNSPEYLKLEREGAYDTLPASSLQEQFLYGPKENITPEMYEAYEQWRSDKYFEPYTGATEHGKPSRFGRPSWERTKRAIGLGSSRARDYSIEYEPRTDRERLDAILLGDYVRRPSLWKRFKIWIGWEPEVKRVELTGPRAPYRGMFSRGYHDRPVETNVADKNSVVDSSKTFRLEEALGELNDIKPEQRLVDIAR